MGILRRLFGGPPEPDRDDADDGAGEVDAVDPADIDEEERRHQAELMASEQARFDDLQRRQEKYASRSWVPPAQGGSRRADDAKPPPGND